MVARVGYQDGRVGGHQAHLAPPTHQKYRYMWKNSQRKRTGDYQKDCYTTKTVKKIYTGLGREGREVIRLGHAPLGGEITQAQNKSEPHIGCHSPEV